MPNKVLVTPKKSAGADIYAGAGNQFSKLEKVVVGDQLELRDPRQEVVAAIGKAGVWLQVRTPRGITGFVESGIVQRAFDKPEEDEGDKLYLHTTATDGLRIRAGASAKDKVLTSVMPNDRLEVVANQTTPRGTLGKNGQWIKVKTASGIVGYGSAAYLEVMPERFVWSMGHALVGLHGPADPGDWPWDDEAFRIIRDSKIKAVKLLAAADIGGRVVQRLKQDGVQFILARLMAKFPQPRTPQNFVDEIRDATLRLYDEGVRYFEVHNEPNLHTNDVPEGMGVAWKSGREFGQFYLDSVAILKKLMPDAQFGFPGVSPGPDVPGVRQASETFLASADEAIRCADFVCMHTYWGADGTSYMDSINKVRDFCNRFPSQLILVTEFSNPAPGLGKDVKGQEYAAFYSEAKKLPSNLGALFSFVMQSSGGFDDEIWRGSPIVGAVGNRPANFG